MDTVNPLPENMPSTRQKRLPSSSSKLEFVENKKEKFFVFQPPFSAVQIDR